MKKGYIVTIDNGEPQIDNCKYPTFFTKKIREAKEKQKLIEQSISNGDLYKLEMNFPVLKGQINKEFFKYHNVEIQEVNY